MTAASGTNLPVPEPQSSGRNWGTSGRFPRSSGSIRCSASFHAPNLATIHSLNTAATLVQSAARPLLNPATRVPPRQSARAAPSSAWCGGRRTADRCAAHRGSGASGGFCTHGSDSRNLPPAYRQSSCMAQRRKAVPVLEGSPFLVLASPRAVPADQHCLT